MSQFEQHVKIKFMCKLGKSASETQSALQQVYSDTALKKSAVYDWFSWFKNGQETLEDDKRSGRPSTSRTEEMIEKVQCYAANFKKGNLRHCPKFGISHGSIHAILSDDLKMRCVSAKFVLRQLTMDQMECRMMVLFDKSTQDLTFLKNIVTSDESLGFAYNPETKMQSSELHTASSPQPKKPHLIRSKDKVMLIAFFDIDSLVYHEFVPPGQTVTGHFYVQVL
ncbi:hypothetical protein B7P43_G04183 [Cryptotermes secundus]|uniref:Mos1 transposase HTH domain-containing protein n=1 Tax=Cryptotermes secundus TaxID=105785 RepID=A0A2J7QXT9_9NEOP|nr:hypothetical protein B7P43_G04183 [Cryptotermes secundus]